MVLAAACGGPPARDAAAENVLLIVADDIGTDVLACYGAGAAAPATPHLDALAAAGVRFERAWADPLCSPTRATIQTGRYGTRTGIGWIVSPGGGALPLEELTIPEMLDRGRPGAYRHAAIGKWHLGTDGVGDARAPNRAGYQHFRGTLWNLVEDTSYFDWIETTNGRESRRSDYATSATVDAALEWLDAAPEPWFCYLAFHAAHPTLHAPPAELHTKDLSGAGPPERDPRPYFDAMVEALDHELGRLLDGVEPDVLARTHVVFLSDNGTNQLVLGETELNGRGKGTLYEGGLRVPLIVAGPRVARRGSTCQALVNTTDLFATVAELAGVDLDAVAERPLDSHSLVPLLADPGAGGSRAFAFAEAFRPNGGTPEVARYAVRDDTHKLIVRPGSDEVELYDLRVDPAEQRELLGASWSEARALEGGPHAGPLVALRAHLESVVGEL